MKNSLLFLPAILAAVLGLQAALFSWSMPAYAGFKKLSTEPCSVSAFDHREVTLVCRGKQHLRIPIETFKRKYGPPEPEKLIQIPSEKLSN